MDAATSQPGESVVAAFQTALAEQPEPLVTEQEPQADSPAPEEAAAAAFDPATIRIPDTAQLPRHAEKYRGKDLNSIFDLQLQTEQWASQKAQEAAQARQQIADLQARLAAKEQVQSMFPATPQPVVDRWQQVGVNPDEAAFTSPRQLADTTLSLADQRSRELMAQAESNALAKMQGVLRQRDETTAAIATFETAKNQIRNAGYDISDRDWINALEYIGPRVDAENRAQPGAMFQPERYVAHFTQLRGGPARPTIPQEGNPPVASSPKVAASSDKPIPTLGKEQRQLREQLAATFLSNGNMTKEQAAAYARGE